MHKDNGASSGEDRATAAEPVVSALRDGIPSALLHFSRGSVTAHVGQRFGFWDGTVWEIVEFKADRTYSPSGFAGTPTVVVRHLYGELTPHMQQYMDGDCTDWCGDSVAAGIHYYDSYIPPHLRPLACRGCGSTKTRAELDAAGKVNCCPERAMNEVIEARHGIPALTPGGVDPTAVAESEAPNV